MLFCLYPACQSGIPYCQIQENISKQSDLIQQSYLHNKSMDFHQARCEEFPVTCECEIAVTITANQNIFIPVIYAAFI